MTIFTEEQIQAEIEVVKVKYQNAKKSADKLLTITAAVSMMSPSIVGMLPSFNLNISSDKFRLMAIKSLTTKGIAQHNEAVDAKRRFKQEQKKRIKGELELNRK